MEKMGIVQARTPESLKNSANDILDRLGLNMSTYINMSLKQLILQEGIPFSVKLNPMVYSLQETIEEVDATLKMEGMKLTKEDLSLLKLYKNGELTTDEIRAKILSEV